MTATLVIVGIIVFCAGGFCHLKVQERKAREPLYVTAALTPDRAARIGTKASGSVLQRMAKPGGRLEAASSRPEAVPLPGGGYRWQVRTKGGSVVFEATPHPDGVRVAGWAQEVVVGQYGTNFNGIMGVSFAMTNALYRMIGLPRDPGTLIRRRKRVLKAVLAAGPSAKGAA